jgi:hypothetical protein
MMKIAADGISLNFDPSLGIIECFEAGGSAPLHTAPWVGHEEMPADADPHLARLGGDFFCAPFAGREGQSPSHGWPANSKWRAKAGASELTATLEKSVFGATLTKTLTLRDGHPFVYQRHVFEGGAGEVAVANHACVSLPAGGIICTSPKRWWETPDEALEPDPARGRSALSYPARGDVQAFPAVSGTCDLTRFPWAPAHEDFVAGVEAPGHTLGWTAVTRLGQGDVFLSLRNATHLPMTMLWHSHGGRDYAPWSGRHRNCLGVEEGAARHMLGLSGDSDLTAPGAVSLGARVEVCHAIGAVPWPGESAVVDVSVTAGALTIRGSDGASVTLPFDVGFLDL